MIARWSASRYICSARSAAGRRAECGSEVMRPRWRLGPYNPRTLVTLTAGTRLGPYEIVSALGSGGMGEVYKARDTRLDRTVAIKVLPNEIAGDPQFRERFDREARVISQLTHPHICTLYDVGEHAGTAFLVMELLEGETLADRMVRSESKGRLPRAEALAIAIQIADALDSCASRGDRASRSQTGERHFDAKSGAGPSCSISAWPKQRRPQSRPVASSMLPTAPPQTLTARGMILGTFQYMAPEQIEGAEADARTDIFAFGCVLLRDADRAQGVRRQDARESHGGDPRAGAAAGLIAAAARAAPCRCDRPKVSGEVC